MSRIVSYMCDFCLHPKNKEEIIGFNSIKGRIEETDIKSSEKHICFKCARELSELAEAKLKKKIVGQK